MSSPTQFEEKLDNFRKEIDQQLNQVLVKEKPIFLYEPMRYIMRAGGKRLRPLLVLLVCGAVGGNYKNALNASIAVELLHNFTLIHDDVMDQDDTRRGQPTVHRKWDTDVAILSGDGLVALSFECLLRTDHSQVDYLGRLFSQALLEVCEGQTLDKEFETKEISLSNYFSMIQKKTAALISLCCELGACIGNADQKVVDGLKNFGIHLGLAFQIQDDLLDIIADEKCLGKTWGSDIKRKKKTMLVVLAKKKADPENRKKMNDIMRKSHISSEDIMGMKEIFQITGTLEHCQMLLDQHFQKARERLNVLQQAEEGRDNLDRFLQSIVYRNY